MPAAPAVVARASWALLFGNLAIGAGVLAAPGALNDLVRALQVSVATGGQLVTAAAFVMGLGAPLLALLLGNRDRRRLLVLALLWFAAGHAVSALAPDFTSLLALRAGTVLGAAVFSPQAGATIGALAAPAQRGRAIAFVFLGWSVASVLAMPAAAFIAETLGWRWAFAAVALLALAAALAVWHSVPDGVRPPRMGLAAWRATLGSPLLMGMVAVTALSGVGQFAVFTYLAPYYRQHLGFSAAQTSFLFLWFGAFGVLGNLWLARIVDRIGPARCVLAALGAMAASFALWPLAGSVALMAAALVPWALGCFSANSAQQARLTAAAPASAQALLALNTSAIYVGQGLGAGLGGLVIAGAGFGALWPLALAGLLAALALSALLARHEGGVPA